MSEDSAVEIRVAFRRDVSIHQRSSLEKAPSSNVSHVAGSPSWEPANASTVAGSNCGFRRLFREE